MSPQQWRPDDGQDDGFDDVIRGSMRARASRSAPPSDGWPVLRSQVRGGPAKRRRIAGLRFQHLVNGIVQGAAAMIVIAMLGATLTPGRHAEVVPMPTPEVVQVVADVQPPSLPLFVPADMPQRPIVHASPPSAPVYLPTRGDTLNMAELIKARPPSSSFNPALLTVFNPRMDPTLNYFTQ